MTNELRHARQHSTWRRRPLIVDDDGDLVYDERARQGPNAFTSLRLSDLVDAEVNSLAWCIMWGIAKGTGQSVRYWQTQKFGIPFHRDMPDPTLTVASFCKNYGMEIFGSIRMNDCQDAFRMPSHELLYPLKVSHPEFLLGNPTQRGGVNDGPTAAMWSGLDYAIPDVRANRLWWIEHTATAYDLDGVNLNFFPDAMDFPAW